MTEIDLDTIEAGEYELVALSWDEPTSKPGEPYDFVTHRKGDPVTLDVEQARRLVVAGAVRKPVTVVDDGDPAGVTPAPGGPASDKVDDILAFVADDPAMATLWLEAELAKEKPRTTLIEQLEAIATNPGDAS